MFEWLFRRWHLKVLALALAVAVWVAVTGEGRGVSDFQVPVDIVLGSGAALSGSGPTNVTVRLRGPDSLLRRVDPYDLSVRVDLRDSPGGDRTVPLLSRNVIGVPNDLEVASIEPDHVRLGIAKKTRREVPVVPTIVGRPPRGYTVYRAIAHPEALLVEGPEGRIAAVRKLNTEPIQVANLTEAFLVRVGAVADSLDLRVVDPRPLDVSVYIDLAPVEATLDRVPVVAPGAGKVAVVPSTIAVTLAAPSAMIAKLRGGHVRAVVDATEPASGLVPRIELPGLDAEERAKVTVRSMFPKKVDLRRSPR